MSVIYYRKALGVGPYETVADYFADLDPEGNLYELYSNLQR